MNFDAVLFDVGGVLLLPDPAVLAAVFAPYGATDDHEAYRRAHYVAMKAKSDAGHRESQWGVYERAFVEAIGVADEFSDHAAEVFDSIRSPHLWRHPIPDSVAALADLEEVPLGIVSNASGQIEAELARQGICQVGPGDGAEVRIIVDSYLVGSEKPDPAIFEHALTQFAEIDRSRIAYVGDSRSIDVVGAQAAGLYPVLFDPYELEPDLDVERCTSLLVLAARVARSN